MSVELLGRGFAWLDTGTNDSLLEASHFVETIERHQGYKVACLEKIGFANGWMTSDEIEVIGQSMSKNNYGQYLLNFIEGKK